MILCTETLKLDKRIIWALKQWKTAKNETSVQSINYTWSSSLNRSQAATVADSSCRRDSRLPTLNKRSINQLEIRNCLLRPIRTAEKSHNRNEVPLFLLRLKINGSQLGSFTCNLGIAQLLKMLLSHLSQLLLQVLELLLGGLLFLQLLLCERQLFTSSFQFSLQLLHPAVLSTFKTTWIKSIIL